MTVWIRPIGFAALAATTLWLAGCSPATTTAPLKPAEKKEAEHKDTEKTVEHKDHKEGDSKDDHDKPLTDKDVKLPDSFKAGVARLEELNKTIAHHIEHGELDKVHRVAEEMALVAKKMKELARKDVPEDKQTEVGRLCNEVSGYYKPIDEAADAGKKPETAAIHKKMIVAVEKLKELAK